MAAGCGCRAAALQVLGMDLTGAPNLAEALLASAGPRLQHLQLVTGRSAPDMLWDGFWSAVRAFTDLTALQLVFVPEPESELDEQVQERNHLITPPALIHTSWKLLYMSFCSPPLAGACCDACCSVSQMGERPCADLLLP